MPPDPHEHTERQKIISCDSCAVMQGSSAQGVSSQTKGEAHKKSGKTDREETERHQPQRCMRYMRYNAAAGR